MKFLLPLFIILSLSVNALAFARSIESELTSEQGKWAFGDNYKSLHDIEFVNAWNARWGKLFEMHNSDIVLVDIKEVKRLYLAFNGDK